MTVGEKSASKAPQSTLKTLLADLAALSNPATDAAIVALIVKVLPGVHLDVTEALAILGGVGVISQWIRNHFKGGVGALAVSLGDLVPGHVLSAPAVTAPLVVQHIHHAPVTVVSDPGTAASMTAAAASQAASTAGAASAPASGPASAAPDAAGAKSGQMPVAADVPVATVRKGL